MSCKNMKKSTAHKPAGLMAKLARSLKIDFLLLQLTGKMSPGAAQRMQHHCDACSSSELCNRLIDHEGGKMAEPPEFCPNRKLFLALMNGEQRREIWRLYRLRNQ